LFSRNPRTKRREPKPFSIVVVIESALPSASTMEMWEVEGSSIASSSPQSIAWSHSGAPGATSVRAMSVSRSFARSAR
jgi:hypothetical protein